jgi:DNA-binding NarL/FixJ family response regulator
MESCTPTTTTRILVFCHDSALAGRLEAIIRAEPDLRWTGSADNVERAIGLCEAHPPEVVVIDSASDPEWNLCLMLTGLFPALRVVALLADPPNRPAAAAWAILHRASGIVTLDAEPDRLGVAVREAMRAGRYVDSSVEQSENQPHRSSRLRGKPLSSRELDVLRLIADGRTAEYIGHQLGISAETVRTHVYRILRKLNARDRAHAVAISFRTELLPVRPSTSSMPHGEGGRA